MSQVHDYYRNMILTSLAAILDRSAGSENDGFINTKLSLFTGKDFSAGDPVRGTSTIYSWIQGRGLESLAVHYNWLRQDVSIPRDVAEKLSQGCLQQLKTTLAAMENLRAKNSGRLLFMHDSKTAKPVKIDADGKIVEAELSPAAPAVMSELFYVKGLAAAAGVLGDDALLQAACDWYQRIHQDIIANRFQNDQQPLDPKNVAAKPVEGRLSHGPRMIAIGAALRFLDLTGDRKYLDFGTEYIDYILANHVSAGGNSVGEPCDMWEFTDAKSSPYLDDAGRLLSDSGHATEFTGLAGKLILTAKHKGFADKIERLDDYKKLLPEILKKNFANGFSENGVGICKAFDLISRRPINSDMPWWPLPETMRSACMAMTYADGEFHDACKEILQKCSDAFAKNFIREDLHMMAYQTLAADGKPVDVIPATPDADPGYHTNMSIIDCLDKL